MMKFPDIRILIFTKAPVPGRVKTRLMPALSAEQAARVHLALLERTVSLTVGAALAPVELWVADAPDHRVIERMSRRHGVPVRAQKGKDLGARMHAAATETLAAGFVPLIIGSDCPEMSADYLREACTALAAGTDVVLGPAEDGGYVLIGLRTGAPALFRDIAWSTSVVMDQTRRRIHEERLSSCELATLWDLDRPADLERLDLPRLLAEITS